MRNPISSEPPVKRGTGEGYYRSEWPSCWWSWDTFRVLVICFLVLVAAAICLQRDPSFMFGLVVGGAICIAALVRSVP